MRINRVITVCFLVLVMLLAGCRPTERKRAVGYLRIGPLENFSAAETHLPKFNLLVRRDDKGLFTMSTLCTYDLSKLERRDTPQGKEWGGLYNESRYNEEGRVIHGPARADLPFFKMVLEARELGGPKDTLYVMDGIEVSREWRLKLPE